MNSERPEKIEGARSGRNTSARKYNATKHEKQRAKTGISGQFGAKNRYILKWSNAHPTVVRALPLVQSALGPFLAGESPGTPESVYPS